MEISRNKAQELAFSVIYTCITLEETKETFDFKEVLSNYTNLSFEESDLYVKLVALNALKNEKEIEEIVVPHLNGWAFKRLSTITKAIIYYAFSSFRYVGDIDREVIINSSIELSKKYDGEKEYKFVNAILDKTL